MTQTMPETPVDVCPTCGAVLHLAGQQHEVWDRRIESLYAGRETFETLDSDPVTRLPDGTPLRAASGKWLSVEEVRYWYSQLENEYELEDVIEEFGHDAPKAPPVNDPEGILG